MLKAIIEFFKNLFGSKKDPEITNITELKTASLTYPAIPALKGQDIIPFAIQHKEKMPNRGTYKGGYPKGAVVHFTAGRYEKGEKNAHDCIDGGIKNGYTYLCIARTGEIVQAHPVTKWGWHAGESQWPGLGTTVHTSLIGIEINNAGKLDMHSENKFTTWFNTSIDPKDVRFVTEKDWECPTGYYQKFSPEQEATLIKTLLWLKDNDPTGQFSFDYVLGHHEVSGMKGIGRWRKNDPGGSLSMPMSKFRQLLKDKYNEQTLKI